MPLPSRLKSSNPYVKSPLAFFDFTVELNKHKRPRESFVWIAPLGHWSLAGHLNSEAPIFYRPCNNQRVTGALLWSTQLAFALLPGAPLPRPLLSSRPGRPLPMMPLVGASLAQRVPRHEPEATTAATAMASPRGCLSRTASCTIIKDV